MAKLKNSTAAFLFGLGFAVVWFILVILEEITGLSLNILPKSIFGWVAVGFWVVSIVLLFRDRNE